MSYVTLGWREMITVGFPIGQLSCITGIHGRQLGKSTMIHDFWSAALKEKWNTLQKQKNGTWKITISTDVEEKIEWCRNALGEGGNGKKSLWRINWIEYRALQGYIGESIDLWLKDDAAVLFKLRWCV
jgi:hypothetical protein